MAHKSGQRWRTITLSKFPPCANREELTRTLNFSFSWKGKRSLFIHKTVLWKMYESESETHSVMSSSLLSQGLYSPWHSPGQNTGVGNFSLLQGIFPTQGSNPGLLHCRWILYQLSHKRSPRILEWVAYPFSSRSSQPRKRTGVSHLASGFFTNWAIGQIY